eukprot:TRINITY_DN66613_c7_g7_i1.p1 TRINITY_DN66613_c7_g7~~TRINITY_DN66613_c7_g7_i1.p1  ORF type:complete len:411 (-),score=215.32 TRINITY_DN66613_c7_g7_i1:64-1296(-)
MSMRAMPILIVCMGGEMMYILQQRLQAQKIAGHKSQRVLTDVLQNLFNRKFVQELFKKHAIYSNSSIYQIMDRLAHSSIMRLNESSMSKLFDLMSMGVKYQLLRTSQPSDLIKVCHNHLTTLEKMISDPGTLELIRGTGALINSHYTGLTAGEFMELRRTLGQFFQDRRVKVSLFLQDGLQNQDGSIVVDHSGMLPHFGETPGAVRYFDENGNVENEENLNLGNSIGCVRVEDATKRTTDLGFNLYAKPRNKTKNKTSDTSKGGDSGGSAVATTEKPPPPPGSPVAKSPREIAAAREYRAAVTAELNQLASLIGGGASSASKDAGASSSSEAFSIVNLFPSAGNGQSSNNDDSKDNNEVDVITFDVEARDDAAEQMKAALFDDEDDGGGVGGDGDDDDDGDDLLDLMDSQ